MLTVWVGQGRTVNRKPDCSYGKYDGCLFDHEGLLFRYRGRAGFEANLALRPAMSPDQTTMVFPNIEKL